MLLYTICLVMTSTALAESQPSSQAEIDPPYCAVRYRRLCKGKGRHIACQFPNGGPGESCVNYTLIEFPKDLRQFVTHYINRRRQRLANGNERVRGGAHVPRPEVMMQVEWDRELAMLAQRLADQCTFVHDDCRATVRFPYAGQTVGEVKWRRTSESDNLNVARAVRRVLDAWWGERRRVTVKQLTQPFRLTNKGNVWGHFSQLAVWTLRAVGCGAVKHGHRYPKILLVCDFSHTNMLGQRTLVPGPLGHCPIHTARQRSPYSALCAPVRHQETEGTLDQPTDYEMNDGEEQNNNYEDMDSNNFLFENTTLHEENEYTIPSEKHKFNTRKTTQTWEESGKAESLDLESDGNNISVGEIDSNQDIDSDLPEEEEPKPKGNVYKIKKMRYRMKPSEKTNQEDESTVGKSDHKKGYIKSGIKRLRDRGKSKEKSNAPKSISPLEDEDIEKNNLKIVKDKYITEDLDTESYVEIDEDTTKTYTIKRIHDKNSKGRDGERVEYPKTSRTPKAEMILQHEDTPKRKEPFGQLHRGRVSLTEKIPERDFLSLKKIPDKLRNYKPSNTHRKETFSEKVRHLESEKQSEISSEERAIDRIRPLGRILQRPPEEDASTDLEPTVDARRPVTKIFKETDDIPIRREPTTDKQRTRYMLKLSDIRLQQKNFDFKNTHKGGSNKQKEFRRIQENQMDKLNLQLAHENYKDSPLEPSNKFSRLMMYSTKGHRVPDFIEFEPSTTDILSGLKTLTTTGEPRRTQFYEPVGLRHRWRPSKERPERPGAKALITNAYVYASTRPLSAKKVAATLGSITMDKDDVEQLFKDTGFNPNWKQYKKILS